MTRLEEINDYLTRCYSPKIRFGISNRFYLKFKGNVPFDECFQRTALQLLEALHRNPDKHFDNDAHLASYFWAGFSNTVVHYNLTSIERRTDNFSSLFRPGDDEYDPLSKLLVADDEDPHEESDGREALWAKLAELVAELPPEMQEIVRHNAHDLTSAEAGKLLGYKNALTFTHRVKRAAKMLRELAAAQKSASTP